MAAASPASLNVTAEDEGDSLFGADGFVQDWQVLVFIFFGWTLLLLLPVFELFCPCCKVKKAVLQPSNKDVDKESWAKLPSEYMHAPKRTLKNFRCSEKLKRLPPPPPRTLQTNYRSLRVDLYKHVRDTVLIQCWPFVFGMGLVAIMTSYWIRFAPIVHKQLDHPFFEQKVVLSNMGACEQVHAKILPLASFMMALYINQRLSWFFEVMNHVWACGGRLHDLALLVGGSLPEHNDEGIVEVKWELYRYLNCFHLFTYRPYTSRFKNLTVDDMVEVGLLLPTEADHLRRLRDPTATILFWISHLVMETVRARLIETYFIQGLMDMLKELHAASFAIGTEVTRKAPVSFAQLIQLIVDGTNFLTPPALAYRFRSYAEDPEAGLSLYLWPAVGSMVIAMFYQGSLQLIRATEDPFGIDIDDLNPDWTLMASDRKLFELLTGRPVPIPTLLQPPEYGASLAGLPASLASMFSSGDGFPHEADETDELMLTGGRAVTITEATHMTAPPPSSDPHDFALTEPDIWSMDDDEEEENDEDRLLSQLMFPREESEAPPYAPQPSSTPYAPSPQVFEARDPLSATRPAIPEQMTAYSMGAAAVRRPSACGSRGTPRELRVCEASARQLLELLHDWVAPPKPVALSEHSVERLAQMSKAHGTRLQRAVALTKPASKPQALSESHRVVTDLLARLHEESKTGAELRTQLARAAAGTTAPTAGHAHDTHHTPHLAIGSGHHGHYEHPGPGSEPAQAQMALVPFSPPVQSADHSAPTNRQATGLPPNLVRPSPPSSRGGVPPNHPGASPAASSARSDEHSRNSSIERGGAVSPAIAPPQHGYSDESQRLPSPPPGAQHGYSDELQRLPSQRAAPWQGPAGAGAGVGNLSAGPLGGGVGTPQRETSKQSQTSQPQQRMAPQQAAPLSRAGTAQFSSPTRGSSEILPSRSSMSMPAMGDRTSRSTVTAAAKSGPPGPATNRNSLALVPAGRVSVSAERKKGFAVDGSVK